MKNKILKILFVFVLVIAIANSLFAELFNSTIAINLSLYQIVLGSFLILFFFYNHTYSHTATWNFISPLLYISFFSLLSAIWSPYPILAIIFSIKLLFIINIFVLSATLTQKCILNEHHLIKLTMAVILITITGQIIGLSIGSNMYNNQFSSAGLYDNGSVISAQILFTLPILLLSGFNKKTHNIFYFLIFLSIILTFRRSAIISYLIIFSVIFLFTFFSSKPTLKTKCNWLILVLLSLTVFLYLLNYTAMGAQLFLRLNDLNPALGGTASGRYAFQSMGFHYLFNRDFLATIMGEGYGYSIIVNMQNGFIPIGMHNDFLDISIGLGFVGLVLLLLFFYKIFKFSFRMKRNSPQFNCAISFSLALFTMAVFTGGFFDMNTTLGYIAFGFIYGKHVRIKMKGHKQHSFKRIYHAS